MDKRKRLEKNIGLLQKSNIKTALQLSYVDASDVVFCETVQGEPNLKRVYRGQTYYYHDQKGAEKEANTWFQKQDLDKTAVFYVYGIGLGYAYLTAKAWLKENPERNLIFFEDDLAVLYRLLETELATEILKNPQVKIEASPHLFQDKDLFDELAWIYLHVPFTIGALPLYEQVKSDLYLTLRHQISYQAAFKASQVGEYLEYGAAFFRNFYPNLFLLPEAFLGNGLFGRFKDIPAIICGAGPSLNKNIDLLKNIQDRALIFAGGSSLNAFCAKGIEPHFGAGIDPNPMQLERIKQNQQFKIPFFYRNRLYHDALKAVQGPHLYLTGSGGYDVATWIEQELGIEGESLDEGHNIVNFSVSIAHALGCNPIIFVGVDLAYTDMKSYAEGIVSDAKVTKTTILNTDNFDSQAILRKDIYGNPIYTLWKWITESEWISDYAKEHPDVAFVNSTEGGIGFDGIPNVPLAEVIETCMAWPHSLKERIRQEIEKNALSRVTRKKIIGVLKKLSASLKKAMACIDSILKEVVKLEERIKASGPLETLETQEMSLYEMELTDEPAYQNLLDNFNMVYLKAYQGEVYRQTVAPKRLSEKKRQLKKLELHRKRLNFLKDVAKVNVFLTKY